MTDESELKSFDAVVTKLINLAKKVDNLKHKQVHVLAQNHMTSICSTIRALMNRTDYDIDALRKCRAGVLKDCEQLSLHASCLPTESTSREDMISVAEFARALCLTGVVCSELFIDSR